MTCEKQAKNVSCSFCVRVLRVSGRHLENVSRYRVPSSQCELPVSTHHSRALEKFWAACHSDHTSAWMTQTLNLTSPTATKESTWSAARNLSPNCLHFDYLCFLPPPWNAALFQTTHFGEWHQGPRKNLPSSINSITDRPLFLYFDCVAVPRCLIGSIW